ncbi:MAG TPA: hypothetical protein VGD80_16555 [Kofleriaceae bacterium]
MLAFLLWLVSLVGGPNPALPLEPSSASGPAPQCGDFECGTSNGTQMTGLAVDVTGDVRAIMLSSGEAFALR